VKEMEEAFKKPPRVKGKKPFQGKREPVEPPTCTPTEFKGERPEEN